MKKIILYLCCCFPALLMGQVTPDTDLYKSIQKNDSLLFNIGFNTCDISQFENLVSDDFEFYHDKSGITNSKKAFLESIKNGLCQSEYKPQRELLQGTMEVFPLENNGILYGAIQMGRHRFFETHNGKKQYESTARFTHVWILKNGKWEFLRGLSYDHLMKDVGN